MTATAQLAGILGDIKLSHSVFALPFAFVGLVIGLDGSVPDARLLLQFVAAMVLARSAAMGMNRLADARLDASNPRTRGRALPAGRVSRRAMVAFVLACSIGFVAVAGTFGRACLLLAPLVLGVLFLYSFTKRFTAAAHVFVGLALGLSPPAAYLAARGSVDADVGAVLWLGLAVLLWVAGFDVIYACQDVAHDRSERLHSIPARLGVHRALQVARLFHVAMLGALFAAIGSADLGAPSFVALGLVTLLLVVEHALLAGGDLDRVGVAFFSVNGVLGLVFGALVAWDLLRWR